MNKRTTSIKKLTEIINIALQQLQHLSDPNLSENEDILIDLPILLTGIITTCADLMEIDYPGIATQYIYTEIEAAMKLGGLHAIRNYQLKHGSRNYSVSNIADNDMETAMNYVGQALSTTLFKVVQEVPLPLRTKGLFLHGVEVFLANLLHGKFAEDNPHKLLDSMCEHVHAGLKDLESRIRKFPDKGVRKEV